MDINKTQIYSDFMYPIFMDLMELYEDCRKKGKTDELYIKTEQYNNYRNGSPDNSYSDHSMKKFKKYGQCYIEISIMFGIRNPSTSFQLSKFDGEYLKDSYGYSEKLTSFCDEHGIKITDDGSFIILHTDDSIIRDYKIDKIFE